MKRKFYKFAIIATISILFFGTNAFMQQTRARISGNICSSVPAFSGVFRVNADRSDELYSVIEGVSTKVPYSAQQQFFMDLAVRLTPPDLLAIECRGNRVSLGSSRAARVEFLADGVTRSVKNSNGKTVRSRIAFERGSLIFTSTGGSDDSLNFAFTLLDNGQSLKVTRRITSQELIDPVVIETVYEKINEIANWDIFDDSQIARQTNSKQISDSNSSNAPRRAPVTERNNEADKLREALNRWINATNTRDIESQMTFYMPRLKAFYLARNAPQSLVRQEKNRAFATAKSIDIRAAEPEIIFQDGGRTAVMRFRKKYDIVNNLNRRSGEVIQELRWQQNAGEWKIFSERDIKVIR